ncbi:MAG: UpxZ family transcription anti-terminator antagonist [Bacteroidaceae bacterium]
METSILVEKIEALQQTVNELQRISETTGCGEIETISHLNDALYEQLNSFYGIKTHTLEQEAALCAALLMGYSLTIYTNPSDEQKKQELFMRSYTVLKELPASRLKGQLLVSLFVLTGNDLFAKEAHTLINEWKQSSLTTEQQQLLRVFDTMVNAPL